MQYSDFSQSENRGSTEGAAPSSPIRVVLLDNDKQHHHPFKLLLEAISGGKIAVVGAATSTKELLANLDHWQPQVVLMDNQLHDGIDGIEATRLMLAQHPNVAVVMYCGQPFDDEARHLLTGAYRAGAVAVVYKETKVALLIETIKRTAAGQEDSLATLFAGVGAPDQF